jgi:hypothetical protein
MLSISGCSYGIASARYVRSCQSSGVSLVHTALVLMLQVMVNAAC